MDSKTGSIARNDTDESVRGSDFLKGHSEIIVVTTPSILYELNLERNSENRPPCDFFQMDNLPTVGTNVMAITT